ncbi:MAG: Rieske 2Fe-2S domain-containing protein [Alphaproteobacteria bacterium]|nr:Rieske 2Fe-2S domain-containing protein [Alphaproteobacteria bacterium]
MADGHPAALHRGIDTRKWPEPALGNARILGDRYWRKEFAEREWEMMWTKVWLIAGLSTEIPNPGDHLTCEIGRESILCVRQNDGGVKAFYNVCQHRGMQLVAEARGEGSKAFACAYHGWRWGRDGKLLSVPDADDFPQGNPCKSVRLNEIPCREWAGLIWYNMDPNCASLEDFLGPLKADLECYRLHEMRRTNWVTMDGDFNWKCVQDNFNESYHLPFVHPQTKFVMEQYHRNCQFDLFPQGHARMFMPGCRPTASLRGEEDAVLNAMKMELTLWDLDPESFRGRVQDMREALQVQKRKMGAEKGYDFENFNDDQLTDHYHYTMFPNTSFSMKPDGCIFLRANPHPEDPERCTFDFWYLTWFPKGEDKYFSHSVGQWVSKNTPAPQERGKFGEVSCGPGIDQDVSIWAAQQKGLRSRGYLGDYMPWQERRVRFFHENLDRYLAGATRLGA